MSAAAQWAWVLDLRHAGRRRVFATAPIRMTEGGLDLAIYGGLSIGTVTRDGPAAGAAVEVLSGETWWRDVPLSRAEAELSRVVWTPGQTARWEDRDVVVAGQPQGAEVGDRAEVVAFGLGSGDSGVADAPYPPDAARVDVSTWPTAPDGAQGRAYPVVYGSPGQLRSSGIRWRRGTQAGAWLPVGSRVSAGARATPAVPVVRNTSTFNPRPWDTTSTFTLTSDSVTRLLISDGWVDADEVTIWTRYAEAWWPYPGLSVTRGGDGKGRRVSTVIVPTGDDYRPIRLGQEWWVAWPDGGGVRLDSGPNGSGLGRLIRWWLARSAVPIHWPSVDLVCAYLDIYQVDGFTDDPVAPTEWVRDRLDAFPARVVSVGGAFGLRPIRWRATAAEARLHLTIGDGADREVAPTATEASGVASVRVRAGNLTSHGTYTIEAVATIPTVQGREEEVTIPELWAAGTAEDLARYHLWRLAIPRQRVRIRVDSIRHRITDGDVIAITDAGLGWDRLPCLVVRAPLPDGRWGDVEVETIVPVRAVASVTTTVYV